MEGGVLVCYTEVSILVDRFLIARCVLPERLSRPNELTEHAFADRLEAGLPGLQFRGYLEV